MKPISNARTCGDGCTYLRGRTHVLAGTVARTCGDGCTYLRGRLHVLARMVARTCGDGCTYLRGQMLNERFLPQTFTMTDANVCGGGCKRLQGRLQTFASERGKNDTEIVSPILDERKGGSIRHGRQPKKREKGKGKGNE